MSHAEVSLFLDFCIAAAITLLFLFVLYVWLEIPGPLQDEPSKPNKQGPIIQVFGDEGAQWEMTATQYLNQIRS